MKKVLLFFILFPLIFFSIFNSVKAENEPFGEVIKISSPTGNRTMEEILNDWETNGWPDYVGYAYLSALNTGKDTAGYMEYWNIGIVKGCQNRISEITNAVSVPVEFSFTEVEFPYNQLIELLPEIEQKYSNNPDCWDVKLLNQNHIRLEVSDLSYSKYQKEVEQYDGRVKVFKKSELSFADGSSNQFNFYKYEISVLSFGIVLLAVCIVSIIIIVKIQRNSKKFHNKIHP